MKRFGFNYKQVVLRQGLLCVSSLAAILLLLFTETAPAQTWNSTSSGDWSVNTNWVGHTVPTSSTTTALTFDSLNSTYTVTDDLSGVFNLNSLTFQPGVGVITVAGGDGSSLRFAGTNSSITTNNGVNAQIISAPVALGTTVTVSGNGAISGAFGNVPVGGISFSGGVSGLGGLTVNGLVSFSTTTATYLGTTTINGTVSEANNNMLSHFSNFTVNSNGILGIFGSQEILSLSGSGTVVSRILGFQSNLLTVGSGTSTTFSGTMEDRIPGSNDLALNKVGSGTLTLSGSSTYSGSTFVSQGTLAAGSTTGLGSNSDFTVSANAFLDLAGNSSTIASLSGAGSVIDSGASATLTTNGTNNATTEYDGTISGPIDLIKDGTGILTLTGDNTYTGGTTVGGGTLLADSSNSTGSGPVDVESGGTIGGYGTVDGKITVESGGSTYPGSPQIVASSSIASEDVSPFVSSSGNTPQILTASSIEYKDGSTAQFAIATSSGSSHPPTPGTDYDQIVLTGNVPCDLKIDSGTTTLQLNFTSSSLAAVQANAQNHLLDNYFLFRLGCSGGTSDGEFSDLTLTEGANTYTEAITNGDATFSSLGLQFDVSYDADSSTDSLTGGEDVGLGVFAVPEPGDWAPLIALLVALAVLQRRCSKQRTA